MNEEKKNMRVKFYGAAREVGRSCILLESNNTKVLLDAGIKLGETTEYPAIDEAELRTVDALIVSHAHLDHTGYIVHMFLKGWHNDIYATKPTLELMEVLLADYIRLSKPENAGKDLLVQIKKHFRPVGYNRRFQVKGLTAEFFNAGHILGSSIIRISDGRKSVIYTGDMNATETRVLSGADTSRLNADVLIMESTNGADDDVAIPVHEFSHAMLKSINDTIKQGGKVIIPSFAIGRGQEVLFRLNDYMRSGAIPKVPIYVDGMINRAMRIYKRNVTFCKPEVQKRISISKEDPFTSENFVEVDRRHRGKIITSQESAIIVATSGMLKGGPVLHYLQELAANPAHKLMFVGFQAKGTLGREIDEGARDVEIDGEKVNLKLAIEKKRISGHSDRTQLQLFPKRVKGLKRIFLVHGDEERMKQLAEALKKKHKVDMPLLGEEFTL